MLRCPVCKAENAQGPQCRRCKADLSLLFQLEEQRETLLASATAALGRGAFDEAIPLAQQAKTLRQGADAERLLALAHLLRRDFAAAWQYQQRAEAMRR